MLHHKCRKLWHAWLPKNVHFDWHQRLYCDRFKDLLIYIFLLSSFSWNIIHVIDIFDSDACENILINMHNEKILRIGILCNNWCLWISIHLVVAIITPVIILFDNFWCCLMQKYAGMKIFYYRKMRSFIFTERLLNTGCTLSISTLCLSLSFSLIFSFLLVIGT